ncbi:MAG: kinase-like domain-containing protein [Benjaminiella poitrasii]|nr:MAG: kinase-like domain-containing protein [Benjaminiella poitrasii]
MSFFSNLVHSATNGDNAQTTLNINGKNFRMTKLLGEGGFSFVYLAEDDNKELFAIKVIRCKMDNQITKNAIKEAIVTDRFKHKNIIQIVDMCMIKEDDGSKTIYIIMPFYKRGNLQDLIDRSNQQGKRLSEKQILRLFKEVSSALQVMADYRNRAGLPTPWAHRDIKPANVLLSDDGKTPVLMDFGSAKKAVLVGDRKEAHREQDDAAEHCSMPYRAPELFDVKPNTFLTAKVDVWSLGCTMFAVAYGQSPFEMTINDQGGGALALAVLNRQFRFPESGSYSKEFRQLIEEMLTVDPESRPDINSVIKAIDRLL